MKFLRGYLKIFVMAFFCLLISSCSIFLEEQVAATSTQPPTRTAQPTSTPNPPLDIQPCAFPQECQDSPWIGDFMDQEPDLGIIRDVVVPFTSEIRFNSRWCVLDEDTLQDNMENITFIFEIDGISYIDLVGVDYTYAQDTENEDITYPCISMGAVLSGWKVNEEHSIAAGLRIENEIFDGWDTYAPQEMIFYYNVVPAVISMDTPTSTPDPIAAVNSETAIRSGPGMNYTWLTATTVNMQLTIVGRITDCSWLMVVMPDGKLGWINADFITYSMPCELIEIPVIPPTPTVKPTTQPTATPCSGTTVAILIKNNTGGQVTLNLKGPCSYTFSLSTGNSTINVLPGTYSFTAYGCGGATLSGSKSLNAGDEWTWYCQ